MKTYKEFKEYLDEVGVDEKQKRVVRGGKKVTKNIPTVKKRRTATQKAADRKRGRQMKNKKQKQSTIRKRSRSMSKR